MNIREVHYEEDYAWTTLATGEVTVVDLEDADLLEDYSWFRRDKTNAYPTTNIKVNGKQKPKSLHKLIQERMRFTGVVDHEDRDPRNNRRGNLREATRSQNQHNHGIRKDNTSGYKGVYWDKQCQKWRAQIAFKANGKRKTKHLGLFVELEDAKAARDAAVKLYHHPDFAVLNSDL